jgi:hypothetical protein
MNESPDGLGAVRELRPAAPGPDPEVVQRARSLLMSAITTKPSTDTSTGPEPPPGGDAVASLPARRRGNPRRRRVGLAVAGATLAIAGTAAAGSLWFSSAQSATSVSCAADASLNGLTVLPSGSGDPVADCTAFWRETIGPDVPPLTAYQHEGGGVVVAPTAAGAPAGARALPPGFRQDLATVQLRHELEEVTRGIRGDAAGCRTLDDAEAIVRGHFQRLRLDDWKVERSGSDHPGLCANAILEGESRTVRLRVPDPATIGPALEGTPGEAPPGYVEPPTTRPTQPEPPADADLTLSTRLAEAMVNGPAARCTSATDARALVERETAAVGLTGYYAAKVQTGFADGEAPDGTTTCVRPAVTVGGTVFVNLDTVPLATFEYGR